MRRSVRRFDDFQREHAWLGFPLAVAYKFAEDQGGYLAAVIAFYGFLSLFPLLLLLVSVLGFLLHDDPGLQQQVLHSALSQFPVIGDQLGENIHSLKGSPAAVAAGAAGSLLGALGVAQAAQSTLAKVWAVPRYRRPDPMRSRLRSLVMVIVLGTGLVASTILTTLAAQADFFGEHIGVAPRVLASLTSVAVNAGLLFLAYHFLGPRHIRLGPLQGSAVGAALLWHGVQWGGAFYVRHELAGATATYGLFGLVLGLLTWLSLGSLLFVLAAETASVRVGELWPRSLLTPFTDHVTLNAADRRAYTSYATTETFKGFERIDVSFGQRRRRRRWTLPRPTDADTAPPAQPPGTTPPAAG